MAVVSKSVDATNKMLNAFNMLRFVALVGGVLLGAKFGYSYLGVVGMLLGALCGGGVGWFVGRVPWLVASRLTQKSLELVDSQRLRERLRNGSEYFISHLLLAHLMARGESIDDELPVIVGLLISESGDKRRFGWEALKFAFPTSAAKICEFVPSDSLEKCRAVVAKLGWIANDDG